MMGKSYLISCLKRHFSAQKGRCKQMVLVHGDSLRVSYGEDFGVKNGGLRPALIIGTFFVVY